MRAEIGVKRAAAATATATAAALAFPLAPAPTVPIVPILPVDTKVLHSSSEAAPPPSVSARTTAAAQRDLLASLALFAPPSPDDGGGRGSGGAGGGVDGPPPAESSSSEAAAAAAAARPSWEDVASRLRSPPNKLERDEVTRVLDGGNAVRLRRGGVVTLGAVRTPSGYGGGSGGGGGGSGRSGSAAAAGGGDRLPDCMTRSPAYGARRLLPPGTAVGVRYLDGDPPPPGGRGGPRPAVLVRASDGLVINLELVRAGFARPAVRGRDAAERAAPGWTEAAEGLRDEARARGAGIYVRCDDAADGPGGGAAAGATAKVDLDEQFEPLESAVRTEWSADGGRRVLIVAPPEGGGGAPPPNPGDTKGCSDFDTYEDALRWYEFYEPWYGDVAKLDRDGDGVPCPGLPHTTVKERYRMKVPARSRGISDLTMSSNPHGE